MAWHATLVMALAILSRLTGVIRQSVIAARFGTSDAKAAYDLAFRIPDTIYLLVIGGALGSVFIPVFTSYIAKKDDTGAWRLASTVFNLAVAIALVTASLAFILAPWLVRWFVAPGFAKSFVGTILSRPWLARQIVPGLTDPGGLPATAQLDLTVKLVRLLLLQPILLGIGGLAMAVLNAFRRFMLTALAPVVYNLGIIAGALFLAPRWGIYGLVAGVLAGAGLYVLVMLPGLARCRMRYTLSFEWKDAGVREVGRLLGPRLLGQMFFQLNFIIIGALASFQGSVAVTALEYAYRLLYLPLGILGVSLGSVAFPTLAELANKDRMDDFRDTLTRILRAVLFLSLPATTLLFVLRTPVIRLLFERGEYAAADTTATAQAFFFFIFELTAASVLENVVRAFYALHDTRTPVFVGGSALVLNIIVGISLLPLMGFPALALGFSLATIAQAGVMIYLLRQRIGGIGGTALLRSGVRSLAAALLAAVAVTLTWSWIEGFLPGDQLITQFLRLSIAGVFGGGLYLAAAAILRSPEIREAWDLVWRRIRPHRDQGPPGLQG
jgi:putative peptidoglycan lipid II flippase